MYKLLPSEVEAKATSLDIQVMELTLSWDQQKRDEADGKPRVKPPSEAEMLAMIEATRTKR